MNAGPCSKTSVGIYNILILIFIIQLSNLQWPMLTVGVNCGIFIATPIEDLVQVYSFGSHVARRPESGTPASAG